MRAVARKRRGSQAEAWHPRVYLKHELIGVAGVVARNV